MPKSIEIPTFKRKLSSMERTMLAKTGWATIVFNSNDLKAIEDFDESFNHKPCDKLNIPREVDQPVNFII